MMWCRVCLCVLTDIGEPDSLWWTAAGWRHFCENWSHRLPWTCEYHSTSTVYDSMIGKWPLRQRECVRPIRGGYQHRPNLSNLWPIGRQFAVCGGMIDICLCGMIQGGLIFVCGSREGLMEVSSRRHNTDDVIATVLAVEPMKFIYRGRWTDVIFVTKIKTRTRIIGRRFQRTRTWIIVIQKTKTK